MNYDIVAEKLNSLDASEGKPLDIYITAAIAGNFTTELPKNAYAAGVLIDWYNSGKHFSNDDDDFEGVFDFYVGCKKDGVNIAVACLKKSGFSDLADIIKNGIKGYESAKKSANRSDDNAEYNWAIGEQDIFDEWIEENEERFHRLIRSWVKTDAVALIEFFTSAKKPFDEACLRYAGILREFRENESSLELYNFAADAGNAQALYESSGYYAVIENDEKKAMELCEKAARLGCFDAAQRCAGYTLEKDKTNFDGAVAWLEPAVEHDHIGSTYMLGLIYDEETNPKRNAELAVKYLQRAADGGVLQAYYNLAPYYEKGEGIEKDHVRAVEYYSIAAVCGQPSAQEKLRKFPNISDYMAKSDEIEKLSRGGNVYATYALGCFAEYREDEEESEKYFKKAAEMWREKAENGDAEAADFLGMCFNEGKGVEEDQAMALKLYTQAEEKGFARASYNIAQLYGYGEGVKYSPKKANEYYIKAAEKGVASAMMYLGRNYDEGCGIKKDTEKAVYWLERAAKEGDDTCAQRCLAHIYDTVLNDHEKARFYRADAAEKGDRTAQKWLARDVFTDTELRDYINNQGERYEYVEYYDSIFEEIKHRLPYRNDRIKLVK